MNSRQIDCRGCPIDRERHRCLGRPEEAPAHVQGDDVQALGQPGHRPHDPVVVALNAAHGQAVEQHLGRFDVTTVHTEFQDGSLEMTGLQHGTLMDAADGDLGDAQRPDRHDANPDRRRGQQDHCDQAASAAAVGSPHSADDSTISHPAGATTQPRRVQRCLGLRRPPRESPAFRRVDRPGSRPVAHIAAEVIADQRRPDFNAVLGQGPASASQPRYRAHGHHDARPLQGAQRHLYDLKVQSCSRADLADLGRTPTDEQLAQYAPVGRRQQRHRIECIEAAEHPLVRCRRFSPVTPARDGGQ